MSDIVNVTYLVTGIVLEARELLTRLQDGSVSDAELAVLEARAAALEARWADLAPRNAAAAPPRNVYFAKPQREVSRVFVHCTAENSHRRGTELVNAIRRYHVDDRGFQDIGYHYLIDLDGMLIPGRSLEQVPAAQEGHNTGTIAIAVQGLVASDFNERQFSTLRALATEINKAYDGRVTFHGHKEVANKACPVFDYREVLGLDMFGHMTRQEG